MSLFKRKDGDSLSHGLLSFLNNADQAYIRAYETRDIICLKKFFSRSCCIELSRVIVNDASSRYFSAEKFRKTDWSIIEDSGTSMTIRKSVTYREVKVSSMKMKISTDYQEDWIVTNGADGYQVEKVIDR